MQIHIDGSMHIIGMTCRREVEVRGLMHQLANTQTAQSLKMMTPAFSCYSTYFLLQETFQSLEELILLQ